jgi:hypothetical protein
MICHDPFAERFLERFNQIMLVQRLKPRRDCEPARTDFVDGMAPLAALSAPTKFFGRPSGPTKNGKVI